MEGWNLHMLIFYHPFFILAKGFVWLGLCSLRCIVCIATHHHVFLCHGRKRGEGGELVNRKAKTVRSTRGGDGNFSFQFQFHFK